jgi:hypothetical protein
MRANPSPSSAKLGALLASLSLLACNGGDLREDLQVAQEESQLVIDSVDDLGVFGLVFGPAIGTSAALFAGGGQPTPEEITGALAGFLQTVNPCLAATTEGAAMTITWGIRGVCAAGGILHGETQLSTAIEGGRVKMDISETVPLTINGTTLAETLTLDIDPAAKTAEISRSLVAIRGIGVEADQFTVEETGSVLFDNSQAPAKVFLTFNLDRAVTFNGKTTRQTLTDLLFQVKVRVPLSGAVSLEGIAEGAVDLDFVTDEAGLTSITATLTKGRGEPVSFDFIVDAADGDKVVEAE